MQTLLPLMGKEVLGMSEDSTQVARRGAQLVAALFTMMTGLIADSHPTSNSADKRWRTYWVIGAGTAFCSLLTLAFISLSLESRNSNESTSHGTVAISITIAVVAAMGGALMQTSTLAHTIELSQCDSLRLRGVLQTTYLVIQAASTFVTNFFCFGVVDSTGLGSSVSSNVPISSALFISATVVVALVPIVFCFWRRSRVVEEVTRLHVPVLLRIQLLWQIVNQRAVLRVLSFLFLFTMLVGLEFHDANIVISAWAGANGDSDFIVNVVAAAIAAITLITWERWWMNHSWRFVFLVAAALIIVPQIFVVLLIASVQGARDHSFYRIVMSVTYIGRALAGLAIVIPVTEVVHEGMEGSMVGLIVAVQLIITVFQDTASSGVFRGSHFYGSEAALSGDFTDEWKVAGTVFFNLAINAAGAVAAVIIFLPTQRLETQQLRKHGGYAHKGSLSIAIVIVVLVVYSITANTMAIYARTRCSVIATGTKCR